MINLGDLGVKDQQRNRSSQMARVFDSRPAVGDGILFLESSPYITGEILHIDGGQSADHGGPG